MKDDIFNMSIDCLFFLNTHLGFPLHNILFPLFVQFFSKIFLVIYMLCVQEYDFHVCKTPEKKKKQIHPSPNSYYPDRKIFYHYLSF